jgi:hypothetical protein
MVRARDEVESRSWSHPQEPATEEWWADMLADPRARTRKHRSSEVAIASRTILPASSTMQMLVSLTDTSRPAK